MNDTHHMVALTALNHMLRKSYFDICTIRSVAEMIGVVPEGDSYRTLSALHCINYGDMPEELRQKIPNLIRDCLGVAPVPLFTELRQPLEVEEVPAKRGFLRLLLTRS